MPKIVPCLWFDGQAQQAAEHYVAIFPDSKILDVTRYGPGSLAVEGSVMTVSFSLDGQEYVGLNGGPARAQRAAQALFQMKKIDIGEIRRAADAAPA